MTTNGTSDTRSGKAHLLAAGLAAVLVLGFAAGCTGPEPELPSVDDLTAPTGAASVTTSASSQPVVEPTSPPPDTEEERTAVVFQSCLAQAGISTVLATANEAEDLVWVDFDDQTYDLVFYNDGQGKSGLGGRLPWAEAESQADRDRLFAPEFNDGQPHLEIDGEDRSDDWASCLTTSGFGFMDQVASQATPDVSAMQKQVDSNNRWASCAREHGFPAIADTAVPAVIDVFTDYPSIVLPVTTDPVALERLMIDCPTFDLNRAEKLEQFMEENPNFWAEHPDGEGYPTELDTVKPYIAVDAPGVDTGLWHADTGTPEEVAMMAKRDALYRILTRAENDYFQQQAAEREQEGADGQG